MLLFTCLGKEANKEDGFADNECRCESSIAVGVILVVITVTAAILLIVGSVLSTQNG